MRTAPLMVLLSLALSGCPGDDDVAPDDDAADDDGADDDTADDDTADDDTADDDTADDDTGDDDTGPPWEPYALLSLNLHCLRLDGTPFATNEERYEAIAAFAAAEGVQVIAVQEWCATDDVPLTALTTALTGATGATWFRFDAFAHVAWEGTPDEADEHVGILAQDTTIAGLSTAYHVQGPLHRVEAAAEVADHLGGLHVTSVHFEALDPWVRDGQARQSAVEALVRTDDHFDAVVLGDFNATEGELAHESFLTMGFRDLTAGLDSTRIDHVFAHRGADLEVVEVRTVFDGSDGPVVSDHRGVLVRIQPGAGEATSPTRFTALLDPGGDHYLTLRGDAPPVLGWDERGWTAVETVPWSWEVVVTELGAGSFYYKWLRDDEDWQAGGDEFGAGQSDNVASPFF